MTTIACDRHSMAADSLVTFSGNRNYQTDKLWRHGGSIFGAAGDSDSISKFRRWQVDLIEPTFDDDADLAVLELRDDGIYLWDKALFPDRINDEEQSYAIGGIGSGVALYCMRELGMSPQRAVFEACKIDTECGLPVLVLRADQSKKEAA